MAYSASWKVIALITALIVFGIVIFLWTQVARASIGNLQIYQGSAELIRSGRSQSGSTGEPIRLGDTLKIAAGSRVAIVLKDSSVIRLEAGTEAEVAELEYQGEKIKQAIFKLKFGRLWSRVAPLEQNGVFEVETPTAVAAVAGTSYNTTHDEQITGVYVYRKRVLAALIKNRSNTKPITAGELLLMENSQLDRDFERGPQPVPTEYIDDWILFNQSEDDKICREQPQARGCEDYFEQPAATPTTENSPTSLPEVSTNQPVTPAPEPEKKPTVAGAKQSQPTIETANESPKPVDTPATSQTVDTKTQGAIDNNQSVTIPTPVPSTEPNPPSISQTLPAPTTAPAIPIQPTPAPSDAPPPISNPPTPNPSPPPKTFTTLVLAADKTSINTNESATLTVTAHYSDQSSELVTSQATFSITQGSIKLVNGKLTSSQAGTVKIKATYENHDSNELTIEVKPTRRLTDVRISSKVDTNERTAQFASLAVYSDNSQPVDVTKETQWRLAEGTDATIDKNTGLYIANKSEKDIVIASFGGLERRVSISIPFSIPTFQ